MDGLLQPIITTLLSWKTPLIHIIVILALTMLARRAIITFIDRIFTPLTGAKFGFSDQKRAKTLSSLLKSVSTYVLYGIALLLILQEFNINTTSIVAGAGVVGLALGVGAQGLIKDFFTGFFIVFENQYAIGDYITVADMTGTVEDITFRITKLRDGNGVLHVIPNSMVGKVSNHSRGSILALVNVPVPHTVPLTQVTDLVEQAIAEVKQDMSHELVDGPRLLGVTDLTYDGVVVRITADTLPMQQWAVERALRRNIRLRMEQANIEYPIRPRT